MTVIVTSSDRFDLLQRTLDSFLALNTYPIEKYVINEDSGNPACVENIIRRYGDSFHILYHPQREGLSRALDNLLLHVDTEYVFNIEDDWEFYGNPRFLFESVEILETCESINQVWIRDPKDHRHPLSRAENWYEVEKDYRGHWGGFSFNPSLRRTAEVRAMFPNGFREFGEESACSRHAEACGYRAVSLLNPAIRHIGWGRHTENFMH